MFVHILLCELGDLYLEVSGVPEVPIQRASSFVPDTTPLTMKLCHLLMSSLWFPLERRA